MNSFASPSFAGYDFDNAPYRTRQYGIFDSLSARSREVPGAGFTDFWLGSGTNLGLLFNLSMSQNASRSLCSIAPNVVSHGNIVSLLSIFFRYLLNTNVRYNFLKKVSHS